MDRSKTNFVINALMFLCMAAMIGIGLLMKFVLIPGKDRMLKYGRQVDLSLLDMDRHEWGTIHLTIGFVLIGLLVLHIILHWSTILSMYRRLIGNQTARRTTASVFLVVCAALIAFPFLSRPNVQEIRQESGQHRAVPRSGEIEEPTQDADAIEVRGFMTINQIAEEYGVPADYLKTRIGLPQEISGDERLGPLKRTFGFEMEDVEKAIREYREPR